MIKKLMPVVPVLAAVVFLSACSSGNIPQAHKGRIFDKTGLGAFYSGGHGFTGPVLPPGTYFLGMYPVLRAVDCSTQTEKEPMTSMTKDGVQFALDIYVSFSANCNEDAAVEAILGALAPSVTKDDVDIVVAQQLYDTFVRPALGESVRQAIAAYDANDLNAHRDELFTKTDAKLKSDLGKTPRLVEIVSLNLSNFKLPDEMAAAAADRATQQVLRDKSVAEQERIKVETQTSELAVARAAADAKSEAAKIDIVGAALHRNPEYYLRDVYFYAADKGGSVVLPTNPNVIMQMTAPARK